jgi:hypothetical protein
VRYFNINSSFYILFKLKRLFFNKIYNKIIIINNYKAYILLFNLKLYSFLFKLKSFIFIILSFIVIFLLYILKFILSLVSLFKLFNIFKSKILNISY